MMPDVTNLLEQVELGDPTAAEELLPLVYDELRRLAAAKLARELPGHSLDATGLVHEAWLRLVGNGQPVRFCGRRHFFGAAAEAMRRILIEEARRRMTIRHGGDVRRIIDMPDVPDSAQNDQTTIVVHELLDQLGVTHPRVAEVTKLRIFLQLRLVEIAEVLGVSADTVETDWAYARAWLKREWGKP